MFFTLVDTKDDVPTSAPGQAFLIFDRWDDWGQFRTQFQVVVFNYEGEKVSPGSVKIAEFGLKPATSLVEMKPGFRAPTFEREFDMLDDHYFSLGQGETYYETLNGLPDDLRQATLKGLKDCALDLQLFERAKDEAAMQISLLREISAENVRNRLHRLALGDVTLTEFWFEYRFPNSQRILDAPVLDFHVKPHSEPPTNVHVLIGRNGVGKTWCLQHIARAVLSNRSSTDRQEEAGDGELRLLGDNRHEWSFASLLLVSFSAFDNFSLEELRSPEIRSAMVSLNKKDASGDPFVSGNPVDPQVKTKEDLMEDFRVSLARCREGLRALRWEAAVRTLENDPLFAEAEITSLLRLEDREFGPEAAKQFRRLSSGHAIVLLTITRLVEFVDERTLVLLEEPEVHLHPPLLSAFIRALADLLIKRNGVAIVATHSPVVLQEVPKSCVWMLRRSGIVSVAERPTSETFGENVGVLTREVFGLEVTTAGFHQLLREAVEVEKLDYDGVLNRFGQQLGAEARAIARAMIADRDAQE